jgi:serine protease Do
MRGLYRMSLQRASSAALGILLAAGPLQPCLAGNDPISAEVQTVFKQASPAVVKIQAEDDNGQLSGSGFFVDPNGTIFTNYSVGGESHDIVVSNGVARYPATRVAADARSGLAILKIEAQRTPYLPLGKSSALSVASMVATIGFPMDLPLTPNVGCVGGFGISAGQRFFAVSHIRANVPVQRGEGGAPLLNMAGEAVGIVESSLEGGAGCYVLPIEAAEKVQNDVIRFGDARPGWLGIRFDKSSLPSGEIEVIGFMPDSPAQKAGLQDGDLILKVGERKISSLEDVLDAAFYLTAGDEIPLTVSRAGSQMEVKVTPAANPVSAALHPPQSEALFNFTVHLGN